MAAVKHPEASSQELLAPGNGQSDHNVESLTPALVQQGVLNFLSNSGKPVDKAIVEPCYRLKQGCHHVVFCIGAHILHALPTSPKAVKSYERDSAITTLIKKYGCSPQIISVPSAAFRIGTWLCTLQERLPGISLEDCPEARGWEKTIEGFVQLLSTLRSIPYDEAMAALYYKHERPSLQKRVAKALRHWEELKDIGYVDDSVGRMKQSLSLATLQRLEPVPYKPVLLHGDLSMQHIFVSESDGVITGVIDWSDAILGDPCEDIAGLALSVGAETASRIAVEVGYDEHTVVRGVLLGKCLAIEDLRELKCGTEQQPPEKLLQAQFRMAFEGTDLANGLASR